MKDWYYIPLYPCFLHAKLFQQPFLIHHVLQPFQLSWWFSTTFCLLIYLFYQGSKTRHSTPDTHIEFKITGWLWLLQFANYILSLLTTPLLIQPNRHLVFIVVNMSCPVLKDILSRQFVPSLDWWWTFCMLSRRLCTYWPLGDAY